MNAKNIVQSMIVLASASLGLVAALSWNDAIKGLIKDLFGEAATTAVKFMFAIGLTVIAVVVVLLLSRLANKIGGEAAISREVEG